MPGRYGLEIRAAVGADASGVSELLSAAGLVIPPRALAGNLEALRQQPGVVLVAVEWGPPSGIVVAHWFRTLDAAATAARISLLLVGQEDRRRGIGRLLVKAAAQAARSAGCGALHLAAGPEQADLLEFCRATGFAEAGVQMSRPLRKRG